MTDYIAQNGNIQMMIRDYGDHVDLLVLTDRATFNHDQLYSYEVNGVASGNIKFDMNARGSWQYITTIYPSYRQNVRFTMVGARIGFPTYDFWQWIERARIPDPPGAPYFAEISADTIHVAFNYGYDGGMGIDAAEIWYSDDPNGAKWAVGGNNAWIGGLHGRTTYYFWSRVHNPLGWSGWSGRTAAATDGIPDPPNPPQISAITDNKVHALFSFNGWNGGEPILEYQVAYGTDPSTAQFFKSGYEVDVTGLQPSQTYYFWSRARNSIGWGYFSGRSQVTLLGPPAAPSSPDISSPTSTTVKASFATNADNGAPIDGWQIGYGKTPDGPDGYFDLGGLSGVVTDLEPGTLYYFWARAHNIYGWGPISALPKTAQTTAGGWINVDGVWKQAVPYVNVNGVWKPAQVWAKIAGVWKATI